MVAGMEANILALPDGTIPNHNTMEVAGGGGGAGWGGGGVI